MLLLLLAASILSPSAKAYDTAPFDGENEFKVTSVLQGDAGTFTNRTGKKSAYFHLAGCETPSPESSIGRSAKKLLRERSENKISDFQFAKGSPAAIPENHFLVIAKIDGEDMCALLIQRGLAKYRAQDESMLPAVASGAYVIAQNKAKSHRAGMWKDGDSSGNFVEDPSSRFAIADYKYKEIRTNGAEDPSRTGFDRPEKTNPAKKDPDDWRTPIYK